MMEQTGLKNRSTMVLLIVSWALLLLVAFACAQELECGVNVPGSDTIPLMRKKGIYRPKIIGGKESLAHGWPWQVSIHEKQDYENPSHICGGSIINKRWILTAAHCLYDPVSEILMTPSQLLIYVGKHELEATDRGQQALNVDKFIVHEKYVNSKQPFDIALLHLSKDIVYGKTAKPICLPTKDVQPGTLCAVTGWGKTEIAEFSKKLLEVYVPVIKNELCQQQYTEAGSTILPSQLCAGVSTGGKDSCSGDSGGPLACQDTVSKRWFLHGLTSFGPNLCGAPNTSGVYTRVTSYIDWITAKMGIPQLKRTR